MQVETPSNLDIPSFVMNFPFTINNRDHNNVLMDHYDKDEVYNYDIAYLQFMDFYKIVAADALVYLLPSEGDYQDQTFVANLGCYLPHIKDKNIVLLANFKSPPRIGEDKVGLKFFESMKYEVYQPQTCWEGEADLKYVRDNIYLSGYGIRTDLESHSWMKDKFEMDIISIKMEDPKLYHLDCIFFPLTEEKALVAVNALDDKTLSKIEKLVDVIPVPIKYLYDGWTNSVRIGNKILNSPFYYTEGTEEAFVNTIIKEDFEPVIINLSEYDKSGAALSCMMMHLNYI